MSSFQESDSQIYTTPKDETIETCRLLLRLGDYIGVRHIVHMNQFVGNEWYDEFEKVGAICDVLIAAETPLPNGLTDYYGMIRMTKPGPISLEHFGKLMNLLDSRHNRFPFCQVAATRASLAWSYLSDPTVKARYDIDISNDDDNLESQEDVMVYIDLGGNQSGDGSSSFISDGCLSREDIPADHGGLSGEEIPDGDLSGKDTADDGLCGEEIPDDMADGVLCGEDIDAAGLGGEDIADAGGLGGENIDAGGLGGEGIADAGGLCAEGGGLCREDTEDGTGLGGEERTDGNLDGEDITLGGEEIPDVPLCIEDKKRRGNKRKRKTGSLIITNISGSEYLKGFQALKVNPLPPVKKGPAPHINQFRRKDTSVIPKKDNVGCFGTNNETIVISDDDDDDGQEIMSMARTAKLYRINGVRVKSIPLRKKRK